MRETFWRYSEALGLFLCTAIEGGGLKNYCETYLEWWWEVKLLTNIEHSEEGGLLA